MKPMPSLLQGPQPRRRVITAVADAIGLILVIDAALSLLPGHASIGEVFFMAPNWLAGRTLVPAALGAAILLRFRPLILAAVAVAVVNTWQYGRLLSEGHIAGLGVCFSAVVAVGVLPAAVHRRISHPLAVAAAAGLLLLAHLFTFGCTDYRRSADAIVVFGARVYADGTPSEALADRTRTGIELYKSGCADTLVFSGGPGEPQAMRRMALAAGVPDAAIVLDEAGLDTAATVRNLRGRFGRVLAVSHYYHNARVKLAARREGLACATVPCRMSRRLAAEPRYVARELLAFAAYYLRLK